MSILSKIGSKVIAHGPTILVSAGCLGTGVATFLACRETLHAEEVLGKCKEDIQSVEKGDGKNMAKAYLRSAGRFSRLYGPFIAVYGLSVGSIIFGHGMLRKRHIVLAAAYTTLNTGFSTYRKRVIEKYGKDDDLDFRLRDNISKTEIEDVDTGEKKQVWTNKEESLPYDPLGLDDTTRFFGPGCINWTKNPEENFIFLRGMEEHFTEVLHEKGYLFLNEVYAALGIEQCMIGSEIGWVYGLGDDCVDFGLIRVDTYRAVNGWEPVFLLDFNHDGYIIDKI